MDVADFVALKLPLPLGVRVVFLDFEMPFSSDPAYNNFYGD